MTGALPAGSDKLARMNYRKRPPIKRPDFAGSDDAPEMWELIAVLDRLCAAYRQLPEIPAAMARRHLRILQRLHEQHNLLAEPAPAPAGARRAARKANHKK